MSDVSGQRKYYERMMDEIAVEHRRQVDQLQAENEKLRTQLADVTESMGRVEERCAKLRELVRALDWCTENFDTLNKCDRCPLPQSKALEPECEVRMRELGIDWESC